MPSAALGASASASPSIVQLRSGAALGDVLRMADKRLGVKPAHQYSKLLRGFSAALTDAQRRTLLADPRVAAIVPDQQVRGTGDPEAEPGVRRVGSLQNPDRSGATLDVDIAILDTGIQSNNPDLNVVGGYNCTAPRTDVQKRNTDYDDYVGHGTHVAGTIGAKRNGSYVVGVAPNTPLYAVRVFRQWAVGAFDSQVICGMDWVAENSSAKGIKVANMSLGGDASPADQKPCGGGTTAFHEAVCGLVRAGVTVVVAAGNEDDNANNHSPATYPEVITVSALSDSDGCTGGKGPDIEGRRGTYKDDTRALFSNFGADVDVAAPGLDILSTVPKSETRYAKPSGLDTYSGTSMAAPHVAGAIALNIKQGRGATYDEETGVLPEGVLKVSNAIQCGD